MATAISGAILVLAIIVSAVTVSATVANVVICVFHARRRGSAVPPTADKLAVARHLLNLMPFSSAGTFLESLNFRGIVLALSLVGPVLLALTGPQLNTLLSLGVSLCLSIAWLAFHDYRHDGASAGMRPSPRRVGVAVVVVVWVAAALYPYFMAAQTIATTLGPQPPSTYDEAFLRADSFLLGWLFPQGQVGLWLDRHSWLGPQKFVGKVVNDTLTVCYMSYFVWPYLLLAYLVLLRALWWARVATRLRSAREPYSQHVERSAWRTAESFMVAWMACFLICLICNAIFPAASPRMHLANTYVNSLDDSPFRKLIIKMIQRDNTYGSFPSGHVSETLAIALVAFRARGRAFHWVLWSFMFFITFLIAVATVWLRYHYVVDVLVGIAVSLVAVELSGVRPEEYYDRKRSQEEAFLARLSCGTPPVKETPISSPCTNECCGDVDQTRRAEDGLAIA